MNILIDHLPSRTIQIKGSDYLFFSGTSYLGMGHQAEFKAALMDGIAQYGTIFSASRNNNLQLKIYEEAEDFIATWTGAEAALTVSSGLAAGQLASQSISHQKFIYAPATHPAIWKPEAPPQYQFNNFDDFSKKIASIVEKETEPIVIACNAIDPLRCEFYDFSWIQNLPSGKPITLLIDDSHGLGITGTEGGGFMSNLDNHKFQKVHLKIIVVASLAKAVGLPGGVILSDKNTISMIRQNPLFVGASPIVPAYLFAFLKSQNCYKNARKTLFDNILEFKKSINNLPHFDCKHLPNYPIFFTKQNGIFDFLFQNNILISNFSYPKPTDAPITRIILSALHTKEDMERLTEKLSVFNH